MNKMRVHLKRFPFYIGVGISRPRLKVSTDYPLGLMVAWSYLDLEAPILAYPQPIESSVQPMQQHLADAGRS